MKHQIPPRTVENKLIFRLRMAALEACKGNQAHAAFFCGVSIRSFSSFINDCRKAGVAIPKYDPTTRLIDMQILGYKWPPNQGGGKPSDRPQPRAEKVEMIRKYAAKYQRSLSKRRVKEEE